MVMSTTQAATVDYDADIQGWERGAVEILKTLGTGVIERHFFC